MAKRAKLKAPFPAFGGKSRISYVVWQYLGNPANYIEPFCFSAANLLGRPHHPKIETINDENCYVSNFWRAIQADPDKVAEFADWPVNEADLHSRHRWLMGIDSKPLNFDTPFLSAAWKNGWYPTAGAQRIADFRHRMRTDPDYFDCRVAGYWCWGACCWIGGGWCADQGTTSDGNTKKTLPMIGHEGKGVLSKQKPDLSGDSGAAGRGIHGSGIDRQLHQRRPQLSGEWGEGVGVNKKPSLNNGGNDTNGFGRGVNGRPQLGDEFSRGRGVNGNDHAEICADRREWLINWFLQLRDRLRTVRVCCGDWLRVCDSPSVTTRLGMTGVFLDPPYALNRQRMHAWVNHIRGEGNPPDDAVSENRNGNLYASDSDDVDLLIARVHAYCVDRGSDRQMRIVLCGYDGEHNALEEIGWEVIKWKASGGYGNRSEKGKANAGRERLWISPHCDKSADGLFGEEGNGLFDSER